MDFLIYLALIPTLGVMAQWLAWRTKLPGILLLLIFGIVLGFFIDPDDAIGELYGDDAKAAGVLFPLVSLAVAVIMFEGGLSLKFSELKESGGAAFRLCTVGAGLTLVLGAIAAKICFGGGWTLALLLAAILVVTGPTVIGPLLRQVRPSRRVANTLKWEGIVIDPIGAILAVLVFEQLALADEVTFGTAVTMLLATLAVGLSLGALGGGLLSVGIRRYWIPDQLQGVAALSVGLLLFAISDRLAHESGLITVTVMGIWMINRRGSDVEHIVEFKENLRTMLIGCLFIVLGSRVELGQVTQVGLPALGFLALLIVVVRPVSVLVSLIGSKLNLREQAFVALMAPRGIVAAAVSSIFALRFEEHGADLGGSELLSTIVFIVITGTVAFYGLLAPTFAGWLNLAEDRQDGVLIVGGDDWVRDFAKSINSSGVPVRLVDTNYNKISKARLAGLDAECLNILNEHAREELELSGIGRMLAMTPNDEVNSLIVRECRPMFGRAGVYQLIFDPKKLRSRRGMTANMLGRPLFGESTTFTFFSESHALGATFKITSLSKEFDYLKFVEQYKNGFQLMGVIDEAGKLTIASSDEDLSPQPGDKILTMVTIESVPESHQSRKLAAGSPPAVAAPVIDHKDDAGSHGGAT